MKCPESDTTSNSRLAIPFVTGQSMAQKFLAFSGQGMEGADLDTVCYLAEWKHVLVFGRRASTATYIRKSPRPDMKFQRGLQDPCQELPRTLTRCGQFAANTLEYMDRDQVTKLIHSTYPYIRTNASRPMRLRQMAEEYRVSGIYAPEKALRL
jgi:hypothetical protein